MEALRTNLPNWQVAELGFEPRMPASRDYVLNYYFWTHIFHAGHHAKQFTYSILLNSHFKDEETEAPKEWLAQGHGLVVEANFRASLTTAPFSCFTGILTLWCLYIHTTMTPYFWCRCFKSENGQILSVCWRKEKHVSTYTFFFFTL